MKLIIMGALFGLMVEALTLPYGNKLQQQLSLLSSGSKLPVVDSETLQSLVTAEQLESHANQLYNFSLQSVEEFGNPTRVIGSAGHWATLEHILATLYQYRWYYDVKVQPFHTIVSKVLSSNLTIDGTSIEKQKGFYLSPPTANDGGFVSGNLAIVENEGCNAEDYKDINEDSIALIKRGTCAFSVKAEFAGQFQAKAAIIYDNEYTDEIFVGTLGEPSKNKTIAPTLGITRKLAEHYIEKIVNEPSPVKASVSIKSYVKDIVTKNIIAETKLGDKSNIVMAGAHTDSVDEGPGINDDGSGTISLLVLAEHLTKFKPVNAIRLGFWAAEEEGLIGSTYYVSQLSQEEIGKHRLFLDYDMMASPNYAYQVYDGNNIDNPAGSEEIKNLYIDWYTSHGLNYTLVPFDGRSDYAAFIENKIPGGGIATGAEGVKTPEEVDLFGGNAGEWYDHCYHQLCDDLTNLDYEAWVINTKLIAHSLATYGRSLEGFPNNTVSSSSVDQKMLYRGPRVVV